MAGIKGIWIPAGIDVENLKKDAETSKAIIAAQTATLVDEVQKQVGVTDKAAQAHDSLQKQYRAASREASALAGANGQLSASALEATAKAGKLKDELMDYREVEKTLGSKAPVFAAFGNATKVAAGGIEAATGAMALFGAKSEDTELMLQHVMGAMAFSKGIQELSQMGDAFIAIKAVI